MPRGRHRHSPPLHRMLPPLTVAGCAAAFAAASLLAADTAVLRVLTVATALTAGAGATLARSWDRSAGRRVAELTTARTREEWRADERIAELETDLEESRDIRGRLEKKLRGKRSELARLRTEHADLLRRYATAESERARALEARRKLQLEGAAGRQLALSAGRSPVGPAAFLKAEQALRDLSRNGAKQQAQRTVEDARRREAAAPTEEEPQGKHAADGAGAVVPATREHQLIPATTATAAAGTAAAVLPYAQPHRPAPQQTPAHRAIGGFDFFGTQAHGAAGPDGKAAQGAQDAQDAQGAQGAGAAEAPARSGEPAAPQEPAAGEPEPAVAEEHAQAAEPAAEVIDLTAHDDTEQLDMSGLRAQA